MFKLLIPFVVLLALLGGSMVWSSGGAVGRSDFRFINRGDIITLDLNQMSYTQDFRITYCIREGLYTPNPVTFRPEPGVAKSVELSADKKVWTFHLRDNAKWSNGERVTAHDFIFSWRRMLEEPGEYTYLFYYIKNSQAYEKSFTAGNPIPLSEVGMEAVDDSTLKVTLNNPVPYLLDILAFPPFYPRHERSMAGYRQFTEAAVMDEVQRRNGGEKAFASSNYAELLAAVKTTAASKPFDEPGPVDKAKKFEELSNAQKLSLMAERGFVRYTYDPRYTRPGERDGRPGVVTNGPFDFKRWDFKRRLVLEKSPTYWDRDSVSLNSIEMVVNEQPLNQFLSYESGEVDWLTDLPGDLAASLKAKGRKDLQFAPAFGTAFLTYMVLPKLPADVQGAGGPNPLADVRVRQALTMAIDKQYLVDNITRMGEIPATTYVPPGDALPGYSSIPGLPRDIEKARQLLSEAGFPNGRGFPTLPVLYNTSSPDRTKIVQVLKNQWKEALNIDLELVGLETKIYRSRVTDKNYAIAIVAWYGDYPDVTTFTDKYLSSSLQNDAGWASKAYDDLCATAAANPDEKARLLQLQAAENMLNTEAPIAPLYHYVNYTLIKDDFEGIRPNSRSMYILKGVKKRTKAGATNG